MGWKWFKFLRAPLAGAPDASALSAGAPYYDTTLNTLLISDGTNWKDGTHTGLLIPFAASTPPTGYLACDGASISRTTYAALFAVIGTTWGAGSVGTEFNIPDLRGASAAGIGTSTGYTQNETIAIATKYNDQLHGHYHQGQAYGSGISGAGFVGVQGTLNGVNGDTTGGSIVRAAIADGTNGTPRTGNVTRGKVVGVLWCIKY